MVVYTIPLLIAEITPHMVNRTLEQNGVIPTGSLTTNRQTLAWCKAARVDPPDVNVDGYFEVLRQHFQPEGRWQGFVGDVGIDPGNANGNANGNAQGGDDAQGIGNAELLVFNGMNAGGAGMNDAAPPAAVPAGVGTNQPRVGSIVGVNPLDARQKQKAEVSFQSDLLLTGYRYRPGEPKVRLSPEAEAFK